MITFKDYVNYLKDNPEGYWFKRKIYGYGWTPATWQGWVSFVAYLCVLIYFFLKVDIMSHSVSDTLIGFAVPLAVATVVFIYILYKKGEKPKWQWGIKNK